MTKSFFKFPSTPHLAVLHGVSVRYDKIFSREQRDAFLAHEIVIEEKIDGANLGISFDSGAALFLQNRGEEIHLPAVGQWKKLEQWIYAKMQDIFAVITDEYILFGEWCYAKHSVFYDKLPDLFLGFDIYDKQAGQFFSVAVRNAFLKDMGIHSVPVLAQGHYSFEDIQSMFTQSTFSAEPAEGLYCRRDEGQYLESRAKIVRPSFVQSMGKHWSRSALKQNKLAKY